LDDGGFSGTVEASKQSKRPEMDILVLETLEIGQFDRLDH
jgi:hypothetical protein